MIIVTADEHVSHFRTNRLRLLGHCCCFPFHLTFSIKFFGLPVSPSAVNGHSYILMRPVLPLAGCVLLLVKS